MTPERIAQILGRFPDVADLQAEQRAEEAKAEEEWKAKEREWQEAAARAKAEGKPAPRPLRREESKIYHYRAPTFRVPRERLLDLCRWLRDNPEFDMSYLSFVSAIDWPDRFEVVYHLTSVNRRHGVMLKVPVPKDRPAVPSVVELWSGADWHEREAYDLFGILFEGHPDLRRIMMSSDWKGHPLRKDYVYEDPQWLIDVTTQRQREIAATGEEWEGRGSRS
ncbi:MAG TPA: NADH-quinone oxidoreductase subunit C [bacterium]|nr:NADH-quinone oxidoreductase subunit C [bacterium]